MRKFLGFVLVTMLFAVLAGCGNRDGDGEANVLNIYSSRHYDIDFDIVAAFEEQTGITVNMIQGNSNEILERAIRESANPQADLFINVGAATLYTALEENLIIPHGSQTVGTTVREGLLGDKWVALATRARLIAYDNEVGSPVALSRYSDIANPEFAGSILVRSSTNIYNISLVAALLQVYGEEEAQRFIDGIVNNLARPPQGNDRDQARAMIAGEGRFAIMNNYYLQMMLVDSDPTNVMVGQRVGWMFPDQAFEDISWAGILNGAANEENARLFIEFMLEAEQQRILMEYNGEAPANRHVQIINALVEQNDFIRMPVDFETLGRYTTRAAIMMDLAGWR
ncbi:MAG: extracellular solute-binding protein [Defluviitaleaceae bacterium]|nr:extracellular solute-binding protein [Defluviitaleaceae bacterium]